MKFINWNQMSELGLIERINREVLHPIGLAMSRDIETGSSDSIFVADDGAWAYPEEMKSGVLGDDEVRSRLQEMVMASSGDLMPIKENVMPTGRAHELKILPQFFNSVIRGDKRAELRKNDRDYQVGDVLILREWTEAHGYSGMVTAHIISDVCDVGFIAEGYVMLSMFKPVEHINAVLVNAPQFVTITGSL